jgi:tRNA threonylcarbamoyladenosine biosynthesis protein TsaB
VSIILNIETATDVCSVAVSKNGSILSLKESLEGKSHAALLTTFISECIKDAGTTFKDLDAVAVSKGPGSYTGLRIGVATAKGICYGSNKPLIAVGTLKAMAALRLKNHPGDQRLAVPMIDARRMEVYTAAFDHQLTMVMDVDAVILDENSFDRIKSHIGGLVLFGDGIAKARHLFENQFDIDDDSRASAEGVAAIAHQMFDKQAFTDTAYFEPFYLKDFGGKKTGK